MSGIYIHVPFCKKKCIYCDFYSVARLEYKSRYLDAVVRELNARHDLLADAEGAVGTIYVGGGTPSLLKPCELAVIADGIFSLADRSKIREFTIEVNPDDVTADYASQIAKLGVNRVSIGIQSFNDSELAAINRRHDAAQAVEAVRAFQQAGISNVSVDLIFGLPGQTLDTLACNVDTAIDLGVRHISVYSLTYEEGTTLWNMRKRGLVREADEETTSAMYDLVRRRLAKAGYEHYEISNFAMPGFRSIHNSNYWNGTPYLGLGPAAHSYDGRVRMYNCSNIRQYLEKIECGEVAFVKENAEWWDRYDETVMVRLRTSDGLDVNTIRAEYGELAADVLLKKAEKFVRQGVLAVVDGKIKLNENGVLVSDYIIRDLMWDS